MKYVAILMFTGVVLLVVLPAAIWVIFFYVGCIREWFMKRKRYTTSQEKDGTISHRKHKGK